MWARPLQREAQRACGRAAIVSVTGNARTMPTADDENAHGPVSLDVASASSDRIFSTRVEESVRLVEL